MRSFASRLIAWQQRAGRKNLPWQNTRDPYHIWVSEIMLQQTQVSTVIPYYLRFLDAFPDVRALASAPIERVLELWSGLGYYRRAHFLHAAARVIVAEHAGKFPHHVDAIGALPGIGRSTAAAIAAFAYGTRGAILDGNVKRVLARHAGIDGFPGASAVEKVLWRQSEARLPRHNIEAYTQAMMDLGASICLRASPTCALCPVAEDCIARREDRTSSLPAPRPRKNLPHRAIAMLLVERQGEVLLERRAPSGIWAGLWSLPEIAVDADAGAVCRSRFGAAPAAIQTLPAIDHAFTHFALTITPRLCIGGDWPRRLGEPGWLWLPLQDVAGAALPAPIKKLLRERARGCSPALAA